MQSKGEDSTTIALTPPPRCQYAGGPCNQDFKTLNPNPAFFIYPNDPKAISNTIREAVHQLQAHSSPGSYKSWETMAVGGKLIFCEICKALRSAKLVVADITTLNFNVLFEIGYAIGLGKAVLPVRDITYERDKKLFEELGIFDVLGYESFQNSISLVSAVTKKDRQYPAITRPVTTNMQSPIYYLRSPLDSDASIKIGSILKKCYFRFRTFDSRETPRLSLHEAFVQVNSSFTVIAHLMDGNRSGAQIHNARCAFVCGLAMAANKHVLMLQEGFAAQPIDYRDVIYAYDNVEYIYGRVDRILHQTADSLQDDQKISHTSALRLLERIEIGDVSAENEILALESYFVKTPQYHQASTGHARLVVGRKGSGKSAVFYAVSRRLTHDEQNIVLDLKPEGHQFVKLREVVLAKMSEGLQLHTLTALWNYLLLIEIAKEALARRGGSSYDDPVLFAKFKRLEILYQQHVGEDEGDFSERVLKLVNRIVDGLAGAGDCAALATSAITNLVYKDHILTIERVIMDCLSPSQRVWVLVDNLDKGWAYLGSHAAEIAILRCLLEATRKIGHWCDQDGVDFRSIVFVRKDIFDLLVDKTPDRGKEAVANLDWSDIELFKQLIARRLVATTPELKGGFDEIWPQVVNPHVFGENSFNYILSRTFLRPRDILNFLRKAIEVAVSREHIRVEQEDLRAAEVAFSEDMLNDLRYEIRDVAADFPDLLHEFIGQPKRFGETQLNLLLYGKGIEDIGLQRIKDLLLWFCFLGFSVRDDERFAYQTLYNLPKLKMLASQASSGELIYVIHPAFWLALECA